MRVVLACIILLLGGSMSAHEFSSNVQFFSKIQEDTHPAVPYVLAWVNAQVQKDYEAFARCFDSDANSPLFLNLPGGVIMKHPKELLARHKTFYNSPDFQVVAEGLQNGMGNSDFFTCSVLVHVTLPNGARRTNYIDMTFLKRKDSEPLWIPARLINTVVDATR